MNKFQLWLTVVSAVLFSINHSVNANDLLDVAKGELIYIQCSGCHAPAYHRTGPKHCGLIGRRIGSANDFTYTQQMRDSEIIWNTKNLDQFLTAPLSMIPGTSMGFAGITSSHERKQLIAYLATLTKKNPVCW